MMNYLNSIEKSVFTLYSALTKTDRLNWLIKENFKFWMLSIYSGISFVIDC